MNSLIITIPSVVSVYCLPHCARRPTTLQDPSPPSPQSRHQISLIYPLNSVPLSLSLARLTVSAMEDALGPFHVPQQSRRIKLRIAPPVDHQDYNIYAPQVSSHLDLPRHHHVFAAASTSSSASPSSSSSPQFLPPRFNSLSSSLAVNDADIISSGAEGIPSSSSSGARLPDRVRNSEVDLRNNRFNDAVMLAPVIGGGGLNLSLATHARGGVQMSVGKCRSAAAMTMAAAPVGPFTGYASILSRSRFLKPAEELLDGFGGVIRRETENVKEKVLEDTMGEGEWTARVNVTDRCGNSSLLSLLHEVYKRYRVYCQQMRSAVTSFKSVAGLSNAAPFISFAIKAVSKHFHCLKNAILDHINFTNNGMLLGVEEFRKRSDGINTLPEHRAFNELKELRRNSLNHHPVWRSQRGLPDKAVAVLKAWLFENFLHPYPTDSDKEMLTHKTGLSRSQVSNWFTNARVRLWKPMVEEIHLLEKQSGFSAESEHRKLANASSDHFSLVNPWGLPPEKHVNASEIPGVRFSWQADRQGKEEERGDLIPCDIMLSNNQLVSAGSNCEIGRQSTNSSSHVQSSNEGSTISMSWSTTYGQNVPFWLAK